MKQSIWPQVLHFHFKRLPKSLQDVKTKNHSKSQKKFRYFILKISKLNIPLTLLEFLKAK